MLRFLFILFVLMPILEIACLIQFSQSFGLLPMILLMLTTAVWGVSLVRWEGLQTLNEVKLRLATGQLPGLHIAEACLLLVAGGLLITPGLITDAIGFVCVMPVSRKPLAVFILNQMHQRHVSSEQPHHFSTEDQKSSKTIDSTCFRKD